ncbi:MAG: hypothetical protein WCI53_02035 [Bacteroidota bacterium]
MKKKILLLSLGLLTFIFKSQAQWTGPTSGILSTSNQVNIAGVVVSGLPGSPPQPAMFNVFTNTGSAFNLKFSVDHTRVDANTNFFVNSGSLFVTRTSSTAGNAFSVNTNGAMTLNTTGIIHPTIGFFINSDNRNFFTVTESQILFKDATQDLFKVSADGYVYARKAIVTLTNPYPDYVFEKNYNLMPLNKLANYINANKHLPNVPSLAEVEANNKQIDIGEMQVKLLEKVEELTLYILQQQKEIEALKAKLAE